jgi:serralysin
VDDVITGSVLSNTINGLDGNDMLKGLAGADTIAGGGGQDLIIGGLGKDNLTGGAGADVFDFDSTADSAKGAAVRDTILDFSRGDGDKIDLSNIDASSPAAGDQAFTFLGSAAFSGIAGQLRYAAGVVIADINGDKVADFEISLANKAALKATDFIL